MRYEEITCDAVRLKFQVTIDDGELVVEDVELADKEAVMTEPDFLHDLECEMLPF